MSSSRFAAKPIFVLLLILTISGIAASQSIATFKEKADKGDAEAQDMLGRFYNSGSNGAEKDFAEAVRWYRKSADQGNADAQLCLGFAYY